MDASTSPPDNPNALTTTRPLSDDELAFISRAAAYLENPSFLMRIANLAGKPAEAVLQALPERIQNAIHEATQTALRNSLEWAIRSLTPRETKLLTAPDESAPTGLRRFLPPVPAGAAKVEKHMHTVAAAGTGAVGGFFGVSGLLIEIPATTTIIMRSIAKIAHESGADLSDPLTRLHCMSILGYGASQTDSMESAYFTARIGVALTIREAAVYMAKHSAQEVAEAVAKGTAPLMVRLLHQIAGRFQMVVTEKVAAQAAPIAGAAFGALINAAFTDHFNTVARYHFGILALEREHGAAIVEHAYQQASGKKTPKHGEQEPKKALS